jgi:hypothetical protein
MRGCESAEGVVKAYEATGRLESAEVSESTEVDGSVRGFVSCSKDAKVRLRDRSAMEWWRARSGTVEMLP